MKNLSHRKYKVIFTNYKTFNKKINHFFEKIA